MNYYDAEKWVNSLTVGGDGWRLPTRGELQGIYEKGKGACNVDPVFNVFKMTGWHWVWSGTVEKYGRGKKAWVFRFKCSPRGYRPDYLYPLGYSGYRGPVNPSGEGGGRAFAVRSGKHR